MYNFKDSERGGVVFWMLLMPFVVACLALIIYGGNAYVVKSISRSKLENSLLSAVTSTYPRNSDIDAASARDTFDLYLRKNFNLNTDFEPLPGSIATGKVEVIVYQSVSAGSIDPIVNDTVTLPSLEALISVPTLSGYNVRVFSRVSVHP
ncbi:MAG: hypothetical protein AB7G87_01330 [Clostridia bacterium]